MGPKCDRALVSWISFFIILVNSVTYVVCLMFETAVAVFFVLTTLTSIGILCWREFIVHRDDSTKLTKENLIRLYPSIFHIYETQYTLENLLIQGLNTLNPVNATFDDGKSCSFSCSNVGKNIRRRRASSNDVYHACCVSNANFISPIHMHNLLNNKRELVQMNPYRQIFKNENCSQAVGCTGCTCMHQMDLVTAVVYKPGYTKATAEDMDHIEIDFFYLPGCCKCVNVGSST